MIPGEFLEAWNQRSDDTVDEATETDTNQHCSLGPSMEMNPFTSLNLHFFTYKKTLRDFFFVCFQGNSQP